MFHQEAKETDELLLSDAKIKISSLQIKQHTEKILNYLIYIFPPLLWYSGQIYMWLAAEPWKSTMLTHIADARNY